MKQDGQKPYDPTDIYVARLAEPICWHLWRSYGGLDKTQRRYAANRITSDWVGLFDSWADV